ncbi:MAG: hypothetical protein IJ219_03990, partial [Bacteroidaceae bacterium]|nr:hypothetical protein [Bacteroidaceae bacterium]
QSPRNQRLTCFLLPGRQYSNALVGTAFQAGAGRWSSCPVRGLRPRLLKVLPFRQQSRSPHSKAFQA